jgi:hypothetical protein
MNGLTVQPIDIVMALGLTLVALGLSLGMIALGMTIWESLRQALRDRRRRRFQLGAAR